MNFIENDPDHIEVLESKLTSSIRTSSVVQLDGKCLIVINVSLKFLALVR